MVNLNIDMKQISSINIFGDSLLIEFNNISNDKNIVNPLTTIKCSICNNQLLHNCTNKSKEQIVLEHE